MHDAEAKAVFGGVCKAAWNISWPQVGHCISETVDDVRPGKAAGISINGVVEVEVVYDDAILVARRVESGSDLNNMNALIEGQSEWRNKKTERCKEEAEESKGGPLKRRRLPSYQL